MAIPDPQTLPVPPQPLRFMNETDESFVSVGSLLADVLYRHGLGPESRLMDVGSGYGRLAVGLMATGYQGTYLGFDILPRHVRWCNNHLTDDPRYRFKHLDVNNARYNPRGKLDATRVRFPGKDESRDFCALFSVFTHFYAEDIQRYLRQIERVLVPGGRAVTTWFVWDQARIPAISAPTSTFPMVHVLDERTRFETTEDPLKAIGYEESFMREMVAAAGLEIVTVVRGNWAKDEPDGQFQDLVVLRKPLPVPPTAREQAQARARELGARGRRLAGRVRRRLAASVNNR